MPREYHSSRLGQVAPPPAEDRPSIAQQDPEVPRALKSLEARVSHLSEMVTHLEQRLTPVRSNPPQATEAGGKAVPGYSSQMACLLCEYTSNLDDCITRLRCVLDTLEV